MKGCRQFKKRFDDYLLHALDEQEAELLDHHLARCQDCSSEMAELKSVLEVMGHRERTEPGEEFWQAYWDNLSDRMEKESAPKTVTGTGWWQKIRLSPPQAFRPAFRWAAVVAALVAGIMIGRFILTSDGVKGPAVAQRSVSPEEQLQAQTVTDRAEQYLEKSKFFLLGFANSNGDLQSGTSDIDRDRDISRGLVREASYLKENLTSHSQQKLRTLVEDLERILIEIANLEEEEDLPDVEMIREGVGRSGILLKINVHQMSDGLKKEGPAPEKEKAGAFI